MAGRFLKAIKTILSQLKFLLFEVVWGTAGRRGLMAEKSGLIDLMLEVQENEEHSFLQPSQTVKSHEAEQTPQIQEKTCSTSPSVWDETYALVQVPLPSGAELLQ